MTAVSAPNYTRARRSTPAQALLAVIGFVLLAGVHAVFVPAQAAPLPQNDGEITWGVTPAGKDQADERLFAEHEIDPGSSVTDYMEVRNLSETEVTFGLQAADGYYTRSGRFDMLASDQESVAAGSWIQIPDQVSIPAGETAVVRFTIDVPEDAEPGDFVAGVAASVISVQRSADGAQLGVDSRVGYRVAVRVSGDLQAALSVSDLTSSYSNSWHPLRPGRLTVGFEVHNLGNTRITPAGEIRVAGQTVTFSGEEERELMPGEKREYELEVGEVWPTMRMDTALHLGAEAIALDGTVLSAEPVVAEATTWAIPWPQLATVLGLALIAWAVLWNSRRRRIKFEAMLEAARNEGRQEKDRKNE